MDETWDYDAHSIPSIISDALASHKSALDNIVALKPEERSFSSVVTALATASHQLNQCTRCLFLENVSPVANIRDAAHQAMLQVKDYTNTASARVDIYQALLDVQTGIDKQREPLSLEDEDVRVLHKWIRDRKRDGLGLDATTRNVLLEKRKTLSNLCSEFRKNQNEEAGRTVYTMSQLGGVPQDVLDGYEKVEKDGKLYLAVTNKYPDYVPLIEYAESSETRETAWRAFEGRCPENVPLLEQIVTLRKEIASLLGYPNWAAYAIEVKMAKTVSTVEDFITSLIEKLQTVAEKELASLLKLRNDERARLGMPPDQRELVPAWEYALLNRKYTEKLLDINMEVIKQYFPVEHVVDTVLQIYQELFSVRFELEKDAKVWHPEVQKWIVYDQTSEACLGIMYLDLFPREGKYGHAAVWGLQPAIKGGSKAMVAMVANLAKPVDGKPALLTHDDVVTFFHELGHAFHGLLSQTKYDTFEWGEVEADFVEAPSQCLESWCFSRKELERMSKHCSTGQSLPEDLVEKIIKSRKVNQGLFNLRQLYFCQFDMKIHTGATPPEAFGQLWDSLNRTVALRDPGTRPTNGQGAFGHLAGGYDAGYYGYLWSLVYAFDMYSRFEKNPMDAVIGMEYRQKVLGPAASKDAMDMMTDFLGRKPNSEAFMKHLLEQG